MNDETLNFGSLLTPSDPTLGDVTDPFTSFVTSSGNPAELTNNQPVSSGPGLGSVIQSIGSDILGAIGINKGTGSVSTPSSTFVPTSVGVSSGMSSTLLIVGGIVVVGLLVFRH